MNLLITGGAGFIGSHLSDRLLCLGHNVTVLDNLSLGRKSNLKEAVKNSAFKFIEGDILDEKLLEEVFANGHFDMVFHLAANSDIARSHANPDVDLEMTFMTTYQVLKMMRKYEVKKIIFASTSAIYGQTGGIAVDESYGPLFPASHYGAGKLASEAFISSFAENYGIQAWFTRFPNVCGERTTHGILHDFIKKLKNNPNELEVLGNGKQAKPYLYVQDLIDAILFIYQNTHEKINVFNVGVEGQTSVTDIANMVIKAMGLNAQIRYTGGDRGWVGDVPKFAYNVDKIHKLGWSSKLTSNQAVEKAILHILETDACNL